MDCPAFCMLGRNPGRGFCGSRGRGTPAIVIERGVSVAGKRKNTRRMNKLRGEFFEEGRRLDADPETRHLAGCWLCKQRIDYDAEPGTTPDSHTLDHRITVDDAPELQEDPDNFEHAHSNCNSSRGKRDVAGAGLGELVPDWW